jgi:hypothetical protein
VLTMATLSKLKQAGVPDKVIEAMQAKKAAAASVPEADPAQPVAKQSPSPPTAPEGKEGVWTIFSGKKDLTNEPFTEARTWQGPFEITALCKQDTYLALWLTPREQGIELMRSAVPAGPKMLGAGDPGELCTHMQVMAGQVVVDYYSPYCDSGHRTSIVFVGENYSPLLSGAIGIINQSTLVPGVLKDQFNRGLGMPMYRL